MNDFYSIAKDETNPEDKYQLKNLGNTITSMIIGNKNGHSKHYYKDVVREDYDREFVYRILTTSPPYEVDIFLNYHYSHYLSTNDTGSTFIKHMKYVILPLLKNKDLFTSIVTEWIKEKEASLFPNKTSEVTNNFTLTGSQNVQINQNSPYSNQNFQYKSDDIKDILLLLKKDIENLSKELKEEINDDIDYALKQVSKNKNITPQLKSIGSFVSNIGTSFFVNLTSSSVYDLAKGLLGI